MKVIWLGNCFLGICQAGIVIYYLYNYSKRDVFGNFFGDGVLGDVFEVIQGGMIHILLVLDVVVVECGIFWLG